MTINFLERFKARCQTIDNPRPPKPRYDVFLDEKQPKFNIQRTFLPSGAPKTILFNLTRANADWWLLHTESFLSKDITDRPEGQVYTVHYEIITA